MHLETSPVAPAAPRAESASWSTRNSKPRTPCEKLFLRWKKSPNQCVGKEWGPVGYWYMLACFLLSKMYLTPKSTDQAELRGARNRWWRERTLTKAAGRGPNACRRREKQTEPLTEGSASISQPTHEGKSREYEALADSGNASPGIFKHMDTIGV